MIALGRQFWLLCVVLAGMTLLASAQVQVLPEMPITGSGSVSSSFIHSNQTGGIDTFNLGLSGDFNGYYYNPSFLQFQVSPYYDLGREFSETEFVTGGKGIGASANLFSGGSFPLTITFHRAATSEATYNIIGSPAGIGGDGTNQDFSVNWTLRLRRLPTVQLSYLKNDGEFTVLGTDARGDSHGDGYSISSQYSLLGFSLTGIYDNHNLTQDLPNIFSAIGSSIDTRQRDLRFGINRNLWHSTYFDSTAERSHWISNQTGRLEDRTFDTASATLTSRITSAFSTNFRMNYSSDLTGLRLASILSGGSAADAGNLFPVLLTTDTHFRTITYTEGMSYNVGHGFRLQASAQQGTASDSNGNLANNDTASGQVNYVHSIFGGSLAAGYSIGLSNIDRSAVNLTDGSHVDAFSGSTVGHSGSLGYSRQIGRGQYSTAFHYSQSDSQTPLLLNSRSFGGEISAQNRFYGWNVTTTARLDKVNVESLNSTSSFQKMFRVAVAKGPLSVAFAQQFTDGLSITTLTGVHLVPVTDTTQVGSLLGQLLAPTLSRSRSLTAAYMATKRLEFDVNWTKTSFDTIYLTNAQSGINDQFDFALKYRFRQLDCRAGYRRYFQQFSGVLSDYNAQTVYFQVSRRFRLF